MSQASENAFNATLYKRHNSRRQEHLASLGLDLTKQKVLEVGAGTGDHSSFFIDRSCDITITEARAPNLAVIKKNLPTLMLDIVMVYYIIWQNQLKPLNF